MDIRTLGNSLNALGEIFHETNKIINGDSGFIDVKANADFISGSFGVEIELFQSLAQAKDILNPLGLLAFGTPIVTVVSIIKWLKGEEITFISSEDSNIKTIISGERRIECSKDVATLVSNPTIRKHFESLINVPLRKEGTSSFIIKKDKNLDENELFIDKDESKFFVKLSVEKKEEIEISEKNIKFIAANIESNSGWKVEIDGKEESVKMNDDFFRERLLNMEEPHIFGRSFNVKLKTIIINELGSKKLKFYIERVHL
jgi:hypothetical protein